MRAEYMQDGTHQKVSFKDTSRIYQETEEIHVRNRSENVSRYIFDNTNRAIILDKLEYSIEGECCVKQAKE